MVALACNHSSQEAETGGSYILMLPGLHGKTLKNNKSRETRQTKAQINPYTYIAKSSINKYTKVCFE